MNGQSHEFRDSTVIVTGGASGIGRAIVNGFLNELASVVAIDINQAGLDELRLSHRDSLDPAIECVIADISDASSADRAISGVLETQGAIDVLVNAAGVSSMQGAEDLSESEWDHTIGVNLKGVHLITRAVLPSMKENHTGHIVNVASAAGKRGSRYLSHYAASKFGVIGYTQSVALEVAPRGIRVNAVCPGLINTPMQEREIAWEQQLRGVTRQEVQARYLDAVPMGRLGQPEDVASVVMFLCSEAARYITGESINVNGGYLMD